MLNWLFRKKIPIGIPEKQRIECAIEQAEKQTSGEIKVLIELHHKGSDLLDRSKFLFDRYRLRNTRERNAVLFYVSLREKQFCVYGDEGIYQRLGVAYWDELVKKVIHQIQEKDSWVDGLCFAIEEMGIRLKKYYPYLSSDKNELSDEVKII